MKPLPFEVFREAVPGHGIAARTLQVLCIFIALCIVLYFGSDVLIPLVIAVLLAVLLAPAVRILQRLGLPKVLAVAAMVVAAFATIALVTSVVALTLTNLAGELPRYESNLRQKAQTVKEATAGSVTLIRAANVLEGLQAELSERNSATAPAAVSKPIPVEVLDQRFGPLAPVVTALGIVAHPLAQFGIVFLMLAFVLMNREDLRNRLIRLTGTSDLPRTTAALDEAGKRLSRYFATQIVINAATGAFLGAVLFLLGVPGAMLWGILTAILRFVPYIGTFLAAILPVIMAVAVGDGWTLALLTIGVIVITEATIGHVVEPLFFGRMTGLSPVAVVIAAMFWTALWGPVGLLLSTPLTVGLLVLGRNIESFEFLHVMLGSGSVLSGEHLFYQRLLADDPVEAAEQALPFEEKDNLSGFLTSVVVPSLMLARSDQQRNTIDKAAATRLVANLATALIEIWGERGKPAASGEAIALAGAPGPLNHAAALAVSALFRLHRIDHVILPDTSLAPGSGEEIPQAVTTLVVCHLMAPSTAQNLYVMKRAKARAPGCKLLATAWATAEEREALPPPANLVALLPARPTETNVSQPSEGALKPEAA